MALLTLTPTSGSPASIQIDENDIYRVTANGAGSTVIYSGPSAFLGDQQTVVVSESVSTIDGLSKILFSVTVGSASVVLNANNIYDVVTDGGSGSKIMYKEFGLITYIFTTQSPAVIKNFVSVATNSTKGLSVGDTFVGGGTASASEVLAGILIANDAAPQTVNLDSQANFLAAGLTSGSSVSFYINNTAAGLVSLSPGAGGTPNLNNSPAFAPNTAMQVAGNSIAKFEIFATSGSAYVVARVY